MPPQGAEYGVVPHKIVNEFPYGTLPHPMILGSLIAFVGFAVLPGFRAKHASLLLGHSAAYLVVLALEMFEVHLGASDLYAPVLAGFLAFHRNFWNAAGHVATTSGIMLGVVGAVNSATRSADGKRSHDSLACTLLAVYVLFLTYTVSHGSTIFISAALLVGCLLLVRALPHFSAVGWLGFLVASVVAQDVVHHFSNEPTFMQSYLKDESTAVIARTLTLHTLWLPPFVADAIGLHA